MMRYLDATSPGVSQMQMVHHRSVKSSPSQLAMALPDDSWSSEKLTIIKGKPTRPSPRTPVSPTIPTPVHATWPMKPLHFFHNEIVKGTEELLNTEWVTRLRALLGKLNMKNQAKFMIANSDYLESALNWLVAAQVRLNPPIQNVIVLCLDHDVFDILDRRDIPSVFVDPSTIANTTVLGKMHYRYTVWMVRLVVFRLVNYWGYDVMSYDSDAVILKNPAELFEQYRYSDVISSAGKYPFRLGRKWGFTVCMGIILFRSSPRTGLYTACYSNGYFC